MGDLQFATPSDENPQGGVSSAEAPSASTSQDGPIQGPIADDAKSTMSTPSLGNEIPSGSGIKFAGE